MHEKKAKIISLVPSWTETLLLAGAHVVGRTRFCFYPEALVSGIPALGGTKNPNVAEILAIAPDYVIMDQEENLKDVAEQLKAAGVSLLVSKVTDLNSAADFLQLLSMNLNLPELSDYAARYRKIKTISQKIFLEKCVLQKSSELFFPVDYVIWKNPFMVIGEGTFISAVLKLAGIEMVRFEKYPKVIASELKNSFCLFSSEPYPFARDFSDLLQEGFKGALVDGEKISWYGIRNLRFLEECQKFG